MKVVLYILKTNKHMAFVFKIFQPATVAEHLIFIYLFHVLKKFKILFSLSNLYYYNEKSAIYSSCPTLS